MRFAGLKSFTLAALLGVPTAAAMLAPTRATAAVSDTQASADPCVQLRADADDGRFACVADGEGGRWAVRLDAPAPGARDLTLSATYVDAHGTRTPFAARVEGAAEWWYTIAPVEQAITVGHGKTTGTLDVDLTRVGFRAYPVGHYAFTAWTPAS